MNRYPDRLTLTVQPIDIEEHMPCSSVKCPIALATRRTFPGFEVDVRGDKIKIRKNRGSAVYQLAEDAKKFILAIDFGGRIENRRYQFKISRIL